PSEYRHQLTLGCASLCSACCACLAQPMRAAATAGLAADVAKPVAERLLHPRQAALVHEVGEIPGFGCRDGFRQRRQDLDKNILARLLGAQRDHVIADMLAAYADGITPAQAGVEQEIEGEALTGAHWPAGLESVDLLLGPCVEALVVRS